MAQIFPQRFDLLFRLVIGATLFSVLGVLVAWHEFIAPAAGAAVEQIVPFSHKHHVGDDGIDCRYCHTSVEKSHFAGLPSSATCMTCHSQIFADAPVLAAVRESISTNMPLRWNRVSDLPDYVYFDHSIHVTKGIGCSTCHGRVDQMPLTRRVNTLYMKWCLDCHRQPQKYVRPRDKLYEMAWQTPANQNAEGAKLVAQYHIDTSGRLTNCSVCHR